ncbi:MAG: aldehyde dehydrogenase family protein [Gemmatimonadetes bacterium]|nr:aldehyde dehydrogenase family protein [Gemmatimonadota bacterium]
MSIGNRQASTEDLQSLQEAEDAAAIRRAGEVFALQRANRWNVAQTTAAQRIAKLKRLKAAIVARRGELAEAMRADFGKHPAEVEVTEIHPALDEVNHAIRHLKRWMKPLRAPTPVLLTGTFSELRSEPKGVVLILAPWNYPFGLMAAPLVAAVAAGNCAVLRPSEKVPHTSAVVARLVADVFDPAEVAVVGGGIPVADALLELPFDHVFFTGSTAVGRKVMAAAARHLASVTLELGGKSPVIVDEEADVAAAARRVAWGKFVNAGQTCIAPDYVLVHHSRERAFLDALKATIAAFYGATEEERRRTPDFCRIVDAGAHRRLSALLEASLAAGAVVETGGASDAAERYISPTVLSGVAEDSPAMRDEIFGPILPVLAYRRLDDVIETVRRGGKPLAMYLFCGRAENRERVLRGTTAGATVVDNVLLHYANPHLPFGGVGESGLGSYHGEFGFRAFSHQRAVMRQRGRPLVEMFYPPYARRMRELAAAMVRRME